MSILIRKSKVLIIAILRYKPSCFSEFFPNFPPYNEGDTKWNVSSYCILNWKNFEFPVKIHLKIMIFNEKSKQKIHNFDKCFIL